MGLAALMLLFSLSLFPVATFAAQEAEPENILFGVPYTADVVANTSYPDAGTELTDGLYAAPYLEQVDWQGRDSVGTYSFTADLGQETAVGGFKANFFQYAGAGVLSPATVVFSGSNDGVQFEELCQTVPAPPSGDAVAVPVVAALPQAANIRYVRLTVSGSMWSFIDEWEVYNLWAAILPRQTRPQTPRPTPFLRAALYSRNCQTAGATPSGKKNLH